MSSKEYNQLLKFLYFEGYADSYAEAEELLESMSDEEFEYLTERSPGDEGSEDRNTKQITIDNRYFNKRAAEREAARARMRAKNTVPVRVNPKTGERTQAFESVVEYLFVEGFANTIENAELMAENISENWVNEILNEKTIKDIIRATVGGFKEEMQVEPPRERLKTDRNMFTIPQKERDAARQRALAKAAAIRAKRGIE